MPLMVHSTCRAPFRTAAREFETARPRSLWQWTENNFVAAGRLAHQAIDHMAELERNGVAHGVGNIDRSGARLDRGLDEFGDGDQRAAGAYQCGGTVEDLTADDVEHEVDVWPASFQPVGLEVQEYVGAQARARCPGLRTGRWRSPVAPASRASWTAIDPTLPAAPWIRTVWPAASRPWSNSPCHAVSPEMGSAAADGVVDVGRERGEVAGLHRGVLGQRAVTRPVGHTENPLADGEAGCAIPKLGDNPRQLVPGHARRPVTAGSVGPRPGPVEFSTGEAAACTRTMTSFSAA